jgi:hypothetical protein
MILTKLQEALAEVGTQRRELDRVETELRSMIARLSGLPDTSTVKMQRETFIPSVAPSSGERDGIDDIVDILRAEGRPLHTKIIAERLSANKGTPVLRTSFESGLNRHVAKVKNRRLDKFGPSTFGLPEWKQSQLFAKTA